MNKKKLNKLLNKIIILLIILIIGSFIEKELEKNKIVAVSNEVNTKVDSNLEVYFFDVGQADSILLKNDNYSMLIDAGNNEDGSNLVDYLKNNLSINNINAVVGTHPHEDHIGGLDNIVKSFDIDKIYLPNATTNTKTFEDLLDAIEEKGYKITVPKIDDEFNLGNMLFKVIYVGSDESDLNNTSIVLRLDFGSTSYLFTGDATGKTEKIILDKSIDVDVLKVGHHGSKYSSTDEFLDKVSPTYAIIEVGEDNSYSHPSDITIKKLNDRNIKIYRTDKDGTIKLISDGNDINFETIETSIDG